MRLHFVCLACLAAWAAAHGSGNRTQRESNRRSRRKQDEETKEWGFPYEDRKEQEEVKEEEKVEEQEDAEDIINRGRSSFKGSHKSRKQDKTQQNENAENPFDIYQSKIEMARREKEGKNAIAQALRSSSNEKCDWRVSPIKYLKGHFCGKHYKIFGLNRHFNDTKEIKKRYRKLSLLLHPDKNPGEDASTAFSALSEGYECLMDPDCRVTYDEKLAVLEKEEQMRREKQLQYISKHLKKCFENFYYYLSWTATVIDNVLNSLWLQFEGFEVLDVPIGKIGMFALLVIFRNPLLYLIGFSRGILSLNTYLAETLERNEYGSQFFGRGSFGPFARYPSF